MSNKRKNIDEEIDKNTNNVIKMLKHNSELFKEMGGLQGSIQKNSWNETLLALLNDDIYNSFSLDKEDGTRRQEEIIKAPTDDVCVVYCDGCCKGNGTEDAICGIGVYFGVDDVRNLSEKITGKQTNNTSELKAISRTLDVIEKGKYKQIIIKSDSQYAVNMLKENGWKAKINIELIKSIKVQISKRDEEITLMWIERDSEQGNTESDRLSRECFKK